MDCFFSTGTSTGPVTSKARAIDPPETQQAPDKRPCPWLKGSQHLEVVKRSDDDAADDDDYYYY